MHEVVAYDGIVLGKRAMREADLLCDIFTPAGLLRARALGARKEESKLRYGLEPLSCGRYSLVRGKGGWRLTGALNISRRYAAGPARAPVSRVAGLLMRLMPGVEPSPELFKIVVEGFDALMQPPRLRENSLARENSAKTELRDGRTEDFFAGDGAAQSIEVVLVLRILANLGYLPHTEALAPYIEGEFSIELSAQALSQRALLVRAINESLRATGL